MQRSLSVIEYSGDEEAMASIAKALSQHFLHHQGQPEFT